MQFSRSTSIRQRAEHRLPLTPALEPVLPTRPTPRGRGQDARVEPLLVEAQTEAPDRIRYAAELLGAGIMMAGFLALAILG